MDTTKPRRPMPYVRHSLWRDDFEDRTYVGDPTVLGDVRNVDVIIAAKTLTRREAALTYWQLESQYWHTMYHLALNTRHDTAKADRIAHQQSVMQRMMSTPDAFTTPLDDLR